MGWSRRKDGLRSSPCSRWVLVLLVIPSFEMTSSLCFRLWYVFRRPFQRLGSARVDFLFALSCTGPVKDAHERARDFSGGRMNPGDIVPGLCLGRSFFGASRSCYRCEKLSNGLVGYVTCVLLPRCMGVHQFFYGGPLVDSIELWHLRVSVVVREGSVCPCESPGRSLSYVNWNPVA